MNFLKYITVIGILLIFFLVGCQKQAEEEVEFVKLGSVVLIDYAAGYLNGTLFDTTFREAAEKAGIFNPNRVYEPAQVIVGEGKIVKGIEEVLLGMKKGEAKTVNLPPEKAYGAYREDAIKQVPIEAFGNNTENLREGKRLLMRTPQGSIPVLVKNISVENVTLDLNHPLAGETVTFAIILRDIQ